MKHILKVFVWGSKKEWTKIENDFSIEKQWQQNYQRYNTATTVQWEKQ